jgi:hypothetical protein
MKRQDVLARRFHEFKNKFVTGTLCGAKIRRFNVIVILRMSCCSFLRMKLLGIHVF